MRNKVLTGTNIRPSPNAVLRTVQGEPILFNMRTGVYFGLDPVGHKVWQHLAGQDFATLVEALSIALTVPSDAVMEGLLPFLDALARHGLIVTQ